MVILAYVVNIFARPVIDNIRLYETAKQEANVLYEFTGPFADCMKVTGMGTVKDGEEFALKDNLEWRSAEHCQIPT